MAHPKINPRENPSSDDVTALIALFAAARFSEATTAAAAMTTRLPWHPFGWKVLGASLRQLGRNADALAPMQKAVALQPDDAEAHNNLGATLRDLGQLREAVDCARRALEIRPAFAEAHSNLGNALADLGQLAEAVASYRRALEIKPDYFEAHSNLGNALKELGRTDDAVVSCRRALEIRPDYAEAHNNLGCALKDLGQLDAAVACYRRALAIKPDFALVHSNLLFAQNYQSDQPASQLLGEALRFGELVTRAVRPYARWPNVKESQSGRRLRIGLVSGDFCQHPVGYFLENVLATLVGRPFDRLEFFAYSSRSCNDAVTNRIKACCRSWQSVVGFSDETLAQRIYGDGIDILLDLAGHTAHNRLPIFAWKPAPVQASWIGYLGTTGVAAMDYLIADRWTLPESDEPNFTEKIWRLPESYLCFSPPDADLPTSATPAIANGYVTFGSFNNLAKINDAVVALWAKILTTVPGSRLFLKTAQLNEQKSREHAAERFASHGIDAGRLILEGSAPRLELLSTYGRVDIALDPFPYPGITTSIEALWMGVPVLTLAGKNFLSRQGLGLLINAGLHDWIANGPEDYVIRAASHASSLPRLAELRGALRQQLVASPLLDAQRFSRNFETALRGMWARWRDEGSNIRKAAN